ncbi:hypothetical protein ATCC90586_006940 [Pythium insidiosum]|nr:hypothetical protein ATCC90586_006940 [Pythium insidiosum]
MEVEASYDGSGASPVALLDELDVPIESLALKNYHCDGAIEANAFERLFRVLGRRLKTLDIRWLPCDELAAVIVRGCPNLEHLALRFQDEGFLSTLLESYAQRPCRLQRLTVVSGSRAMDLGELLRVLSTPTHALSRVLRTLDIDVTGQHKDAVLALADGSQKMLRVNGTLRSVVLRDSDRSPESMDCTKRGGGWSSQLPPMRHRLAALSALRRWHFPVEVLAGVLTLAGRPVVRFRLRNRVSGDYDDRIGETERP